MAFKLNIYYDFDETLAYSTSDNFTEAKTRMSHIPDRHKVEAFRIDIVEDSNVNLNFELNSMAIEVAVRRGTFKLPGTEKT